ncbi:hypothetical protein EIO60_00665|nr:hypothetical protein [Candidatus Pantoea persica]
MKPGRDSSRNKQESSNSRERKRSGRQQEQSGSISQREEKTRGRCTGVNSRGTGSTTVEISAGINNKGRDVSPFPDSSRQARGEARLFTAQQGTEKDADASCYRQTGKRVGLNLVFDAVCRIARSVGRLVGITACGAANAMTRRIGGFAPLLCSGTGNLFYGIFNFS